MTACVATCVTTCVTACARTPRRARLAAVLVVAAISEGAAQPPAASVRGAWRVVEVASRAPGEAWGARPGPQAGLYVFSARHYSYFYVPGVRPRPRFADANRPTEVEKAGAYDTMIAGAGTYTFDGRTLVMTTELRKNPNEMTGEVWRWSAEGRGDTLRLLFDNPPFLPGREWRTTLVRAEDVGRGALPDRPAPAGAGTAAGLTAGASQPVPVPSPGDAVRLIVVPGAGHFEVAASRGPSWTGVRGAVRGAVRAPPGGRPPPPARPVAEAPAPP